MRISNKIGIKLLWIWTKVILLQDANCFMTKDRFLLQHHVPARTYEYVGSACFHRSVLAKLAKFMADKKTDTASYSDAISASPYNK